MLGHLIKFVRDKIKKAAKPNKKKSESAPKQQSAAATPLRTKNPVKKDNVHSPTRPEQAQDKSRGHDKSKTYDRAKVHHKTSSPEKAGATEKSGAQDKTRDHDKSKPHDKTRPYDKTRGYDKTRPHDKTRSFDKTRPADKAGSEQDVQKTRPPRKHPEGHTPREVAETEREPREKVFKEDTWDPSEFKVPQAEGKTRFHDLNLPKEIMHAIFDMGFQYCTPIQSEILFNTLAGKDATGKAQTGTGKTAAFLISTFSRLLRNKIEGKRHVGTPRALVIAPTRELVMQIEAEAKLLSKYTRFRVMSVFGGMDYQKQKRQLNGQYIDLLVATPGRLLDFQSRKDLFLNQVEVLVIDEADRMLDMGFIPDVRKIVRSTPPKEKRQTLFFSATLNDDVRRLASYWTNDAVVVEIEPEHVEVESVNQIVYIVTNEEKLPLLLNMITQQNLDRVIIFANRRDETRDLFDLLQANGVSCSILSGDVDQRQRVKTLDEFKSGKVRVLVATDVAGRGLHVEGISHVFNFTLPQDAEDYVHRIGRTGRAGALGTSISFASEDDSFYIPAIEKFLGHPLTYTYPDPELLKLPEGFKSRK